MKRALGARRAGPILLRRLLVEIALTMIALTMHVPIIFLKPRPWRPIIVGERAFLRH